MNCLEGKIPQKIHFFNLHDSSLGGHVNVESPKASKFKRTSYYKTKNSFEAKIF